MPVKITPMLLRVHSNNYFSTVILKNLFISFKDKMDVRHEGFDKYILNYPNSSRIFGGYELQAPYILIYTPYLKERHYNLPERMKSYYLGNGRFKVKQVNHRILTALEKIISAGLEYPGKTW